jgi:hypothetical protein
MLETACSPVDSRFGQRRRHDRLPNTTNIGFKYIEGEAILFMLNQHGICASSGSACTSGSLDPSHVLTAMGLPYTILHGSIRFSLSRFTTEADVQHVLAVMPGIVERLRAMSPFNNDQADWLQGRMCCDVGVRELVHSKFLRMHPTPSTPTPHSPLPPPVHPYPRNRHVGIHRKSPRPVLQPR